MTDWSLKPARHWTRVGRQIGRERAHLARLDGVAETTPPPPPPAGVPEAYQDGFRLGWQEAIQDTIPLLDD